MRRVMFAIVVAIALPVAAQFIRGVGTIRGTGTFRIEDNCSIYRDGETNAPDGSDKNLHAYVSFPLTTTASFELCRAAWYMQRTGNPAGTVTMSIWSAGLTYTPLTMLAESAPVTLTTIPTNVTEVSFTSISTTIANGGNYALVLHYSSPVGGSDPDFIRHFRFFTGDAALKFYRSSDPNLGWAEDGQSAHAAARLFSQ